MDAGTLSLGIAWYACFLFSLSCHEAAHALAARLGGDPTAYNAGQMTLNPVPHMRRAPFGTIIVPALSYIMGGWMIGWAHAPYDPYWQERHPHRAARMALAGPLANFAIVLAVGIVIKIMILSGSLIAPEQASFTQIVASAEPGQLEIPITLLSILFSLNLLLGIFNLIPVPPLDGITALGLFLSRELALKVVAFARNPTVTIVGILIAWRVVGALFGPIFRLSLNLLHPGAGYH